MADIFLLVVLPFVIVVGVANVFIRYSRRVASSNDIHDRVRKVARRKRSIHDSNERYTDMNKLMLPEKDEDFKQEMLGFFMNSIRPEKE